MTGMSTGLPPDSMTVDQDRLYWTNDMTSFINSVDKRTGLDLVSDVAGSASNILAFGQHLQPFPGKQSLSITTLVTCISDFRFSCLYGLYCNASTGWAKKRGHYVRPLRLTDHVFKTYWPICMIFGVLQRRFVLIICVNFNLIKSITESGAIWWKSATRISLSMTTTGISA